MSGLRIITADQRMAEQGGIKGVIFGPAKIGKTSLLWTLDPGSTLFVDLEAGGVVREFGYSFQDDRYTSQDLTLLARHMLQDRNVVSWAYQQEPFSVIWCALSDGTLAGLTYMREHDVIGWHRHNTDGVVEQIAGLPGTPDDALWCMVRRERMRDGVRDEVRTVERLAPFFDSPERETAFFVDSGLSYVGPPEQEFGGLEHLEGREVAVFCDGYVHPPRTVHNGSIRLERPVRVAHVGLPYAGELSPTLPEAATQQGNTLLKIRKITALKLRLYRSMNLYAGLNGRAAQPLSAHKITGGSISPTPWWAERADVSLVLGGGWEEETELLLRMPDPTPATLLALVTTVDVAPLAGSQE